MTSYIQATKGPIPGSPDTYHMYVSGLNGSDNGRAGTSATQPLATIDAALRKLPDIIDQNVIIHVGANEGGAPYSIRQMQRQRGYHANLAIIGDGGGQDGEDGFTVVDAGGAAQGGSTQFQLTTSGGLSTDALAGKTLEILTATDPLNVGARRTIRDNTTTVITPCIPFPAALSAGDTYRVVEPAIALAGAPALANFEPPRSFMGAAVQERSGPVPMLINFVTQDDEWQFGGMWSWYGLEVTQLQLRTAGCVLRIGADSAPPINPTRSDGANQVAELFGLADHTTWLGWGCYAGSLPFFDEESVVGAWGLVWDDTLLMLRARVAIQGGRGGLDDPFNAFGALSVLAGSECYVGASGTSGIPVLITQGNAGENGIIVTSENLSGSSASYYGAPASCRLTRVRIVLTSGGGAGVFVRGPGAYASLPFQSTQPGPVVANGSFGAYALRGGRIGTEGGGGAGIADGSNPPSSNFAAGEVPATRASFSSPGMALAGVSGDSPPVNDGSVITRVR